ncbi:MAG TPA: HNH endonuclease [Phaeodactylibacter sp.]|nr:HNH endonuclease [Phaeodactylibacter sp.]
MEKEKCLICNRVLGSEATISKHHLTPKSRGGKNSELVTLHNICHQKIHSVFSIKELKDEYHTIGKLLEHEEIKKFIKWVAKRHPDFYQRNQTTNRRKLEYLTKRP